MKILTATEKNTIILDSMRRKQNQILYWSCQIIGWGLYFGFLTASIFYWGQGKMGGRGDLVFTLQVVIALTLFSISHGLRSFFKRKQWTKKPVKWVFLRLEFVLVMAALLSQVVIHLIMFLFLKWQDYRPLKIEEALIYAGNVFLVFNIWSLFYFSYHYWQNNRKKESENWQLKAQLKDAELTILKSQINPHFLFNALNNIRSLILSEPEKARSMVTHISELMRYFIQFNAKEKVMLEQELSVVKDYLALEKIQFDERLTYDFDVDESINAHKIPPMAIQLLVENAVKHGISQLPNGGHVQIEVQVVENELCISVINTGQLYDHGSNKGIGLKNLKERIEILFGTLGEITLDNHLENSVKASIKIPL